MANLTTMLQAFKNKTKNKIDVYLTKINSLSETVESFSKKTTGKIAIGSGTVAAGFFANGQAGLGSAALAVSVVSGMAGLYQHKTTNMVSWRSVASLGAIIVGFQFASASVGHLPDLANKHFNPSSTVQTVNTQAGQLDQQIDTFLNASNELKKISAKIEIDVVSGKKIDERVLQKRQNLYEQIIKVSESLNSQKLLINANAQNLKKYGLSDKEFSVIVVEKEGKNINISNKDLKSVFDKSNVIGRMKSAEGTPEQKIQSMLITLEDLGATKIADLDLN